MNGCKGNEKKKKNKLKLGENQYDFSELIVFWLAE